MSSFSPNGEDKKMKLKQYQFKPVLQYKYLFKNNCCHCRERGVDKSLLRVVLGVVNREEEISPTKEVYRVKRIIRYSNSYVRFGPGDISLLELQDSVHYTPYIQPLCVVGPEEVMPLTSTCYATGWGRTEPEGNSCL